MHIKSLYIKSCLKAQRNERSLDLILVAESLSSTPVLGTEGSALFTKTALQVIIYLKLEQRAGIGNEAG